MVCVCRLINLGLLSLLVLGAFGQEWEQPYDNAGWVISEASPMLALLMTRSKSCELNQDALAFRSCSVASDCSASAFLALSSLGIAHCYVCMFGTGAACGPLTACWNVAPAFFDRGGGVVQAGVKFLVSLLSGYTFSRLVYRPLTLMNKQRKIRAIIKKRKDDDESQLRQYHNMVLVSCAADTSTAISLAAAACCSPCWPPLLKLGLPLQPLGACAC